MWIITHFGGAGKSISVITWSQELLGSFPLVDRTLGPRVADGVMGSGNGVLLYFYASFNVREIWVWAGKVNLGHV